MKDSVKEIRITAKTLENAICEAASKLKVDQSRIEYRIVSQTSGGFFSFLGKKIEISAWEKEPHVSPRTQIGDGGGGTESDIDISALKDDLRLFCREICSQVAGESVEVTAELNDDRLVLDIENEYLGQQMAKNSKLAESLEHVLRKKPRHLKRELPFRIFVDVKGVRRRRESELVHLAKDLSHKVSENKRPIVLNYKSSYDRKIIHMALDKDRKVYTKSVGTGPNRKLMILPSKKKEGERPSVMEMRNAGDN